MSFGDAVKFKSILLTLALGIPLFAGPVLACLLDPRWISALPDVHPSSRSLPAMAYDLIALLLAVATVNLDSQLQVAAVIAIPAFTSLLFAALAARPSRR